MIIIPLDYEINKNTLYEISNTNNDNYKSIASIIIQYREAHPERKINLFFMLKWIDKYFKNLFEIIIIEQDNNSKLQLPIEYNYMKHIFLFNNGKFNREWGYNCAVKHYINTEILALIDNDIILNKSFFDSIIEVYQNKFDIISPYTYIYSTNHDEKIQILNENYNIQIPSNFKRSPYTISGGIMIIKKQVYLDLGGYEEYKSYGCEDRAMDCNILHFKKNQYKMINDTYIHLYHDTSSRDSRIKKVKEHMIQYYRCTKQNNSTNFHAKCKHRFKTLHILNEHRKNYIGNLDLYKNPNNFINSIPPYNIK